MRDKIIDIVNAITIFKIQIWFIIKMSNSIFGEKKGKRIK